MGSGRKVTVSIVTVIQLALFAVLLTWHVTEWNRRGWTGLGYSQEIPDEIASVTKFIPHGDTSRQVGAIGPRSPAARSDASDGDRVVSVNGIDATDLDALQTLSRNLSSGDDVTYVLERNGDERQVVLTLESPFRSPYVNANLVTGVVVGLCWLAISLLVSWSRPQSEPAIVFFLLCSTGTALYLVWAVSELWMPDLRGILPMTTGVASWATFLPATVLTVVFTNFLLHLSLVFPKRRPVLDRWPKLLVWLHGLPFLALACFPVMIIGVSAGRTVVGLLLVELVALIGLLVVVPQIVGAVREEGWRLGVARRPFRSGLMVLLVTTQIGLILRLFPEHLAVVVAVLFMITLLGVFLVWLLVYAVLTCIALIRSYRESGVEVRHQVRWPLWGTLTALVGSTVVTALTVALGYSSMEVSESYFVAASVLSLFSKAVYLLIPIGFAFAILKYRLLDIDILIRKTVIYSGVTGVVLASYLILAGISGLVLVRAAGLQGEVATVVATLAVVALFVPIRSRVQSFVDRRFFQRERDLEAARERIVGLAVSGSDLDATFDRLADETQQALHSRSVAVFLRSGEMLRVAASVGIPDEGVASPTLKLDSPLLQTGTPIVRPDGLDLGEADRRTVRRVRASIMAVAERGGEPVAVLSVGPKLGREPFDEDDELFLQAAAEQMVLAIGRSQQSQSQAELSQAREIQESLLPRTLPQIAGVEVTARWKPARAVGGDYYDAIRLDDERLMLCIGDVVGKGMPAALLMSSLQAALKAVASQNDAPKEICTQVRRVMLQNLTGGTFITFFVCVIDRARGRLAYTNAGHNPPVLVRSDGTLVRLDVGGPILARIAADMPYQEASVSVGPGDRLVLFTDGVTEAMDAQEEMFEDDRLEAVVLEHRVMTARELERTITESVLAHADGQLQDDLTLLVAAIT